MTLSAALLATLSTTALTTPPRGFIGLGIMGEGMVSQLLQAGTPVHVWSRNAAVCEKFKAEHDPNSLLTIEDSPRAVMNACERTYLMLSTPEVCEEVYTMPGGILEGVEPGKQLVDCATLRPNDMASLAERVSAKGGAFLEAPVSGSKGPAATGTLIFMAAGEQAVYEAAADDLGAMGKLSVYCGQEVGMATKMKLVVNLIMGTQLAAIAEGMALAEGLGLSAEDLQSVLDNGAMASPMVKLKGPLMASSNYSPAFPLKYALKDMKFALGLEEASKLPMTASKAATAAFDQANQNIELSESDFCAIMEMARKISAKGVFF